MNSWHIMFPDGRSAGPVTTEQVRNEIAAGRVPPGTAACPVGGSQWAPVTNTPELSAPPSSATMSPAGAQAQAGSPSGAMQNAAPTWPHRQGEQVPPGERQWAQSQQSPPVPTRGKAAGWVRWAAVIAIVIICGGAAIAILAVLRDRPSSGAFCRTNTRGREFCWEVHLESTPMSVVFVGAGNRPRYSLTRVSSTKFTYRLNAPGESGGGEQGTIVFIDSNTITEGLGTSEPETYSRKIAR